LYSVVIKLDGHRFTFEELAGEDLGTYEGEFVRQRCIRVTRDDSPLTVYFRPAAELARLEVVVELGRIWLEGTSFTPAHPDGLFVRDPEGWGFRGHRRGTGALVVEPVAVAICDAPGSARSGRIDPP
jgi:hypothetical protein